jgi:hypothetical protein
MLAGFINIMMSLENSQLETHFEWGIMGFYYNGNILHYKTK